MIDDLSFLQLWDLYSPLLTPTQREITDLYFNYDLSLGEIAEQKNVSRQSVSDCLQKCRKQLESYEEKLHFRQLLTDGDRAFSAYRTTVSRWIAAQKETGENESVCALEQSLKTVLREHDVEVIEN